MPKRIKYALRGETVPTAFVATAGIYAKGVCEAKLFDSLSDAVNHAVCWGLKNIVPVAVEVTTNEEWEVVELAGVVDFDSLDGFVVRSGRSGAPGTTTFPTLQEAVRFIRDYQIPGVEVVGFRTTESQETRTVRELVPGGVS